MATQPNGINLTLIGNSPHADLEGENNLRKQTIRQSGNTDVC
jgi:hypothetical protein